MGRAGGNRAAVAEGDVAAVERRNRIARQEQNRAEFRRVLELNRPDPSITRDANLGSSLLIERGLVEVVDRALIPDDPDQKNSVQRNGMRAQRVSAVERLSRQRNPKILPHHVIASNRYEADFLIGECGARPGPDLSGVHTAPWSRTHYSDNKVDASRRFQAATRAALPFAPILRWCVLQQTSAPHIPPTVQTWGQQFGWSVEYAVGYLRGGLDMLSEYYDTVPRGWNG